MTSEMKSKKGVLEEGGVALRLRGWERGSRWIGLGVVDAGKGARSHERLRYLSAIAAAVR